MDATEATEISALVTEFQAQAQAVSARLAELDRKRKRPDPALSPEGRGMVAQVLSLLGGRRIRGGVLRKLRRDFGDRLDERATQRTQDDGSVITCVMVPYPHCVDVAMVRTVCAYKDVAWCDVPRCVSGALVVRVLSSPDEDAREQLRAREQTAALSAIQADPARWEGSAAHGRVNLDAAVRAIQDSVRTVGGTAEIMPGDMPYVQDVCVMCEGGVGPVELDAIDKSPVVGGVRLFCRAEGIQMKVQVRDDPV